MKLLNKISRKLRHGSISAGIVAVVIAAVLLLNIGFTALCSNNLWFLDMTSESYYNMAHTGDRTEKTTTGYTLMEETKVLLRSVFKRADANRTDGKPAEVEIIFCADPDMLVESEMMRQVYYTALLLEKEFPEHIDVRTTNVWTNPSSVDAYRTNSYSQIYQTNIIIASGGEFRIATPRSFYVYSDDGSNEPWAYHGEKEFVAYMLAVTRVESPICCLTTNQGTKIKGDEYSEFRKLIESVGYTIRYLDLETEEIPADCRLIITFAPETDFKSDRDGEGAVSVSQKLRDYLNNHYAYMVFADASTPSLPNMEEFLETWGIAFERYDGDGVYQISDPNYSLDAKTEGVHLIGQYETAAPSAKWTQDMREYGASPKVIFSDAIGIRCAKNYVLNYQTESEDSGKMLYTYGYFASDGYERSMYDIFRTGKYATAYATKDGEKLTDENGNLIVNSESPFRLMTVTSEDMSVGEGSGYTVAKRSAYVCAVGSTRFVSNDMLLSETYGNTDAMLSVLRSLGKEVEPVGLSFKVLHPDSISEDAMSSTAATVWTVVLVAVPAVALTVAGVFVLVRRKTRH